MTSEDHGPGDSSIKFISIRMTAEHHAIWQYDSSHLPCEAPWPW
jgi:hypothetical protein